MWRRCLCRARKGRRRSRGGGPSDLKTFIGARADARALSSLDWRRRTRRPVHMGQCCSQPDNITAADSVSNDVPIAGNNQFRITLYAVRHGEAVHNVKEKEAKMTAEASLRASTENPSPEAIKEAIEQERQKVLQDPSLHDAALSPNGKSGACDASAEIAELIRGGLPAPTLVLASPLKRALQTASLSSFRTTRMCARAGGAAREAHWAAMRRALLCQIDGQRFQ